MNFKRETWSAVIGKASSGKTYFVREHIKQVNPKNLWIYDFTHMDYTEFQNANLFSVEYANQSEIEEFLSTVYATGNAVVVLDEADNYLRYNSPVISRFVFTARNRSIGAFVILKRAKSVMPAYRNRFNKLILFQTTLVDDIKYLEEWCGVEKGRLNVLRTLKQGFYIEVDLDIGTIAEPQRL